MAGSAEDVRDNLNGLDKAISCIILQKTIDRNLLLVTISKNRISKQHIKEVKNDKTTKPQELVRLYDLLLQVRPKLQFTFNQRIFLSFIFF